MALFSQFYYWAMQDEASFRNIHSLTVRVTLQVERSYEEVDHEYYSDVEGSGSVASDEKSPKAHHNGSYRSTYAEEDDLSAAE